MNDIEEEYRELIMQKLAKNQDFALVREDKIRFTPEETMVIRDHVKTSTNGMFRLKQIIGVLRPELKDMLFDSDIRQLLHELETKGVVP